MAWQDLVLTIVNFVFSISLIPQVYHGFKAKVGPIQYHTSVPTFVGLCVVTATYLSLNLYLSSVMAGLTALLWFTLCLQRVYYHGKTATSP